MTGDTAPPAPRRAGDAAVLGDGAALAHLLDLAGPSGAAALLAQIGADLATVRAGLTEGLARQDRAGLRAASHVLVSLSGTVGAERICAAARALCALPAEAGWADLSHAARALVSDIDRLGAELSARAGTADGAGE